MPPSVTVWALDSNYESSHIIDNSGQKKARMLAFLAKLRVNYLIIGQLPFL